MFRYCIRMPSWVFMVCISSLVAGTMHMHVGSMLGAQGHGRMLLKTLPPIYGRATGKNITLEHVVPQAVIHSTHPMLLRGRTATLSSRLNKKLALTDLHNQFAAPQHLNQIRGIMPFTGTVRASKILNVGNGNYINTASNGTPATFYVNPAYRGVVARAVLYMSYKWGCDPAQSMCGGEDQAWQWHCENPPEYMECLHNYIVFRVQNNTNPFITNRTDGVLMLRDAMGVEPDWSDSESETAY